MHATVSRAALAAAVVVNILFATHAHSANTADAKLQEIYKTEWAWREDQLAATEDTQKPIADKLPSMSSAAQLERLKYWEEVLEQLDAIPRAELSPAEQVNYDVYRPQIEVLVASQKLRDYEMPANSDSSFWSDLGYTARRPFRTLQDYRNWIAQMRQVPRFFREQMEQMRAGARRGFTPPRITMEGRDASIAAVVDAAPEASQFYAPFMEMTGIPADQQAALREEAVHVIRDAVQPAHGELLAFMRKEYLPRLRTTISAQKLPNGAAYYRAKIREFTTLDLSADDIHAIGLAEVEKIRAEMLGVIEETGFQGDFPAFLKFLRTDPQFYAKTPEELLMRAAWIAKRFDAKASRFFGYLPRARFAIEPVPDEIAPYYTAGRGGPGLFLVNTYNLPGRPLYSLPALALHESAPGHAFQMSIALEHEEQPAFRRHTYISAFGEGWALYCERLGVEMGIYETPYQRFGMLSYQMWRAARLVVDTGIHSKGWTRDRALAFLRDNTALPEQEIATEVDRYIAWPGQALSYYLGEMTLWKARARAEQALGERFNIRAFHDTLLELGSVPLPVLDARIERFIAAGGTGPYPDLE